MPVSVLDVGRLLETRRAAIDEIDHPVAQLKAGLELFEFVVQTLAAVALLDLRHNSVLDERLKRMVAEQLPRASLGQWLALYRLAVRQSSSFVFTRPSEHQLVTGGHDLDSLVSVRNDFAHKRVVSDDASLSTGRLLTALDDSLGELFLNDVTVETAGATEESNGPNEDTELQFGRRSSGGRLSATPPIPTTARRGAGLQ